MTDKSGYYVDSIHKMDRIFRYLEVKKSADFMSIVKDLEISKSSAFRLISYLLDLGYLEKSETNKIRLGIRLFSLGYTMGENISIIQVAHPHLEKLSVETGFAVHLGMLNQDNDGIFLDRVDSRAYTFTDTVVGGKMALHCSAAGKCLVAWEPADRIEEIIAQTQFTRFTDKTIMSADDFRKELNIVRKNGYSIDDTEHESIIKAIGAPIFNWDGKVVAAVSIGAFKTEFENVNFDHLIECIKATTAEIGKAIGPKTRF